MIESVRTVRLSQTEFDALVMLAFNYPAMASGGAPKLVGALNEGRVGGRNGFDFANGGWGFVQEAKIKANWADINKSGKSVVPGLVNRRAHEMKLFFEGKYF